MECDKVRRCREKHGVTDSTVMANEKQLMEFLREAYPEWLV